jgi:hypothetical protein
MADEKTVNEAPEATVAPEAPATNGNANGAEQQGGADLTVQDLNALKAIIDVASQRGAFKPNEMTTVGQTYTKLENFLIAIQAQQQQQTEGAPKGE